MLAATYRDREGAVVQAFFNKLLKLNSNGSPLGPVLHSMDTTPELPDEQQPPFGLIAKPHRKGRRKKLSRAAVITIWVVGCLVTLGTVGRIIYSSSRPAVPPSVRAIASTQAAIRARFADSGVVTFSPLEWTRVDVQAGKYVVSGWGKVINAAGANISFNYTSTLGVSSGQMSIESLDLLPQ